MCSAGPCASRLAAKFGFASEVGKLQQHGGTFVTRGNFVWNGLYTRDVEAAKAFYPAFRRLEVRGHADAAPELRLLAHQAGDKVTGILDMRGIVPDADPPHWLSYIEVDHLDQILAEIQSHGGRIVRPRVDVPNYGRIAIGAEATGAFMPWARRDNDRNDRDPPRQPLPHSHSGAS
jgi:predicted enzyme related to lactoylglutathione lyase